MDPVIGTVPDTWVVTALAECCHLRAGPSGSTLRSRDYVIGGVPVVAARDIGDLRIVPVPATSVTPQTADRLHKYRLIAGDILIVRVGDTTRHALVTAEQDRWLFGNTCIRLRPDRAVNPRYLSCYLAHPAIKEWLAQRTRHGVMPTLAVESLAALSIALPPAHAQRAIVDVIKGIDAKIQAHRDVVRTAEELRQLLLPQLLSGEVVPEGASDAAGTSEASWWW